ncbi:tyrosine-type recombinase/integrase [Streptomyces sp. NPDC001657]|uniref:tyrosine-type recombinase/integrase n=1 Tax=Streptomyces sp. NPDC001657 TaxID=3154522 RepID=UPI0033309F2F
MPSVRCPPGRGTGEPHRAPRRLPGPLRPPQTPHPGSYRDVPLAAFLEQEIEAHLRRWGATPVGERDVLFARGGVAAGTMPTATTYGPDFRRAVRAVGLLGRDRTPKYTPHTLRHFFASTALAHGVPVHEVSRWLGHTSIKTTVDIYGHLVPAAWERCRQALERALGPAPADPPVAVPQTVATVAHRTAPAAGSPLDPVAEIRVRAGHSAAFDVSVQRPAADPTPRSRPNVTR